MKITFLGDIMAEPPYRKLQSGRTAMILVGYLPIPKKLMEQSDFVVGNLETPLAGKQTNTNPCLNAPDEYVDALLDAGVKLVSTANSHTFDRGYEGCKIASGNPSTAKATTADSFSQRSFLKENEEVCGRLKTTLIMWTLNCRRKPWIMRPKGAALIGLLEKGGKIWYNTIEYTLEGHYGRRKAERINW